MYFAARSFWMPATTSATGIAFAAAIVTGPISKESWSLGGFKWPGHTELLAFRTKAKRHSMMFSSPRLRVALAADYRRLEFLRVLRSHELQPITDPGALIAPPPAPPVAEAETGEGTLPADAPSTGTGDVTEGSPTDEATDG